MPRLLNFLVAEQVIIDELSRNVSIINLLETLQVEVPSGESIPHDVAVPITWRVFVHWLVEPGEIGQRYDQQLTILCPDGITMSTANTNLQFTASQQFHRNIFRLQSMPISIPGQYQFVFSVRRISEPEEDWTEVARYPIMVAHVSQLSPSDIEGGSAPVESEEDDTSS